MLYHGFKIPVDLLQLSQEQTVPWVSGSMEFNSDPEAKSTGVGPRTRILAMFLVSILLVPRSRVIISALVIELVRPLFSNKTWATCRCNRKKKTRSRSRWSQAYPSQHPPLSHFKRRHCICLEFSRVFLHRVPSWWSTGSVGEVVSPTEKKYVTKNQVLKVPHQEKKTKIQISVSMTWVNPKNVNQKPWIRT